MVSGVSHTHTSRVRFPALLSQGYRYLVSVFTHDKDKTQTTDAVNLRGGNDCYNVAITQGVAGESLWAGKRPQLVRMTCPECGALGWGNVENNLFAHSDRPEQMWLVENLRKPTIFDDWYIGKEAILRTRFR